MKELPFLFVEVPPLIPVRKSSLPSLSSCGLVSVINLGSVETISVPESVGAEKWFVFLFSPREKQNDDFFVNCLLNTYSRNTGSTTLIKRKGRLS